MNKPKLISKDYGFEAIKSYNKYVPNSDSTQEDIQEIVLQYLLKGYQIEKPHAYWAWLNFCEGELKSPWKPVTSTLDVPALLNRYVSIERNA